MALRNCKKMALVFFKDIFFSLAVLPGGFWRSPSSGLLNGKAAKARERIVLTARWEAARLREPAGRPLLSVGVCARIGWLCGHGQGSQLACLPP